MSETRRLGDLSLGEHITIGNEVWEITGKNITGQVILEKVRNEYNPSWWIRSPSVQRKIMEGPVWYGEARDKYGARIVDEMVPDKAYLYQLYATCFLEFDSLGAAKAYYEERKKEDPYFDIDPVAIIDTHDPEARKRWKRHMKKEETP